jgi:hypothetical protein
MLVICVFHLQGLRFETCFCYKEYDLFGIKVRIKLTLVWKAVIWTEALVLTLHVIVCIDIWYTPVQGSLGLTVIVVLFINWTPLCVCVFVCALPNRFRVDVPELHTADIRSCCNTATGRRTIKCRRNFPLPQHDPSHRIRSQVVNTI